MLVRVLDPGFGRSCRSSPARCATPSACRTRSAIPASSRCRACRRGPSSRTPRRSRRKTRPPRRRPTRTTAAATYGAQVRATTAISRSPRPRCGRRCRTCRRSPKSPRHIMIEETKQGLNIEIVDQDGRSMFPEGAKEPYERTRRLIQKLAGPLKAMPFRISIAGHTVGDRAAGAAGLWAVGTVGRPRQCGAADSRSEGVPRRPYLHGGGQGRHRSRCFRTIPSSRANRRVTITLMREEPPLPVGFQALDSACATAAVLSAACSIRASLRRAVI